MERNKKAWKGIERKRKKKIGIRKKNHDRLNPPPEVKNISYFKNTTMQGFGTLAIYRIYPDIYRLFYPNL